jgi:hypothetical protein
MRTKLFRLAIVVAGLTIPIGAASALVMIMPIGPATITNADAVFIGKVTEIEPADVDAKAFPGAKETVKYKVAVVTINETILGAKDVKSVRVGFQAAVAPKPGVPIIGGGRRGPTLTVGQEGLFVISMHADGKFYQAPNFGAFVPTANKTFDNDVKLAKRVVTVMANTKQALESKDADERLMAAAIQITKYRTPKGSTKQEPIDATESKLILTAISTGNWKPARQGDPNPQTLFFQLGIGPKDGWQQPKIKGPDDLRNAIQAWIRANENYRIQRYVVSTEK